MLEKFLPETINLTIDPKILWILFFVTLIIYVTLSAVMYYHWNAYSYAPKKKKKISVLYFSGSAILLGIIMCSIIIFSVTS